MQNRRITLIAREQFKPDIDWNYSMVRAHRVAFLGSMSALGFALGNAANEVGLHVERLIVDRACGADEFLVLLDLLPADFDGDALLIRDDGTGMLSALGRGCSRILYSLASRDVRFYLELHELVTAQASIQRMTATRAASAN